jgi:hypothetical protein
MVHTKIIVYKHLKPSILVGNNQKVAIIENYASPDGVTTSNLQVHAMPIHEQETFEENVVNDEPSKEHKVLGNVS